MSSRRLVVTTANSLYEVMVRARRFRRLHGSPAGVPPLSEWRTYHRVGPIVRGHPMRLWWTRSEHGRVAQLDLLTTAPVVDIAVTREAIESDPAAPRPGAVPGRAAGG